MPPQPATGHRPKGGWAGPSPQPKLSAVDGWPASLAAEPASQRQGRDATHNARVLVVDDDPAIRFMLTDALAQEGWEVDAAEHGVAALAKIRRAQPDVILLDLMMPVMDGWETVERLRHEGYEDIPVIVLTAAPMLHRIQSQFPRSPVIGKPFDLGQLVATIHRTLDSRQPPGP